MTGKAREGVCKREGESVVEEVECESKREREKEREGEGGGCRERVYIYMYGMVIVYLTQYISIHIRIYCVTNIKYVLRLHYKNTEDAL